MSTTITPPAATAEEPKFDVTKFLADRNARDTARAAGKEPPKVEAKAEPAKPDDANKTGKPSGDRRTLFKTVRENERLKMELEQLRQTREAAEEKKPVVDPDARPERSKFATDDEHREAVAEWKAKQTAEKVLKDAETATAEQAELKRVSDQFEAQMKAAADPEKGGFADWHDLLKTSKAASVDIYTAAPELFGALISSKYAKEVMYELLQHPERLEFLIDTFKTDKREAIAEFQALVGEVRVLHRKKEPEKKAEAKAETKEPEKKAVAEGKPKPRPTASARVNVGEAAPDDPAPGTKAWMEKRNAQIRARGF